MLSVCPSTCDNDKKSITFSIIQLLSSIHFLWQLTLFLNWLSSSIHFQHQSTFFITQLSSSTLKTFCLVSSAFKNCKWISFLSSWYYWEYFWVLLSTNEYSWVLMNYSDYYLIGIGYWSNTIKWPTLNILSVKPHAPLYLSWHEPIQLFLTA